MVDVSEGFPDWPAKGGIRVDKSQPVDLQSLMLNDPKGVNISIK